MNLVWAEIDEFTGHAVRIFRNRKTAFETISAPKLISKALATSQIRRQVFTRQEGVCINCPTALSYSQIHLHEKQHRGEFNEVGRSGEVSLENCEALCFDCHINIMHADRAPKFLKNADLSGKRTTEEWEPRTR